MADPIGSGSVAGNRTTEISMWLANITNISKTLQAFSDHNGKLSMSRILAAGITLVALGFVAYATFSGHDIPDKAASLAEFLCMGAFGLLGASTISGAGKTGMVPVSPDPASGPADPKAP